MKMKTTNFKIEILYMLKFYGFPKVFKPGRLLQLTFNSVGCLTHDVAKYLVSSPQSHINQRVMPKTL